MAREEEQLPLFQRSVYLKKLWTLAKSYSGATQAEATKRAYASDWRDFQAWCRRVGGRELPATPETVALYLCDLAERFRVSTLERRLADRKRIRHRAQPSHSQHSRQHMPIGQNVCILAAAQRVTRRRSPLPPLAAKM